MKLNLTFGMISTSFIVCIGKIYQSSTYAFCTSHFWKRRCISGVYSKCRNYLNQPGWLFLPNCEESSEWQCI